MCTPATCSKAAEAVCQNSEVDLQAQPTHAVMQQQTLDEMTSEAELNPKPEGSRTPASIIPTPVSPTVFVLPGQGLVGQQTEQVPELLTGLNQRVHRLEQFLEDNVVELLFENVQLRMHQALDEHVTAQP